MRGKGEDADGEIKAYLLTLASDGEMVGGENDLRKIESHIYKIEQINTDNDYIDHVFKEGKYTVSLKFKDNQDQWSDACQVTVEIAGGRPQVLGVQAPVKAPSAGSATGITALIALSGFVGLAIRIVLFLL